jgi:hypothetical protein
MTSVDAHGNAGALFDFLWHLEPGSQRRVWMQFKMSLSFLMFTIGSSQMLSHHGKGCVRVQP